ncbi:MAG: tRNA (guanosine(37)-N1)-methyltransferase TrmD [Thermodesulfobacteriota bacterium]|nr:tRNA (guanosine(37)-N1)-methyltransferase TrmD [Thermodesulfobacteriota bacterium]
MLFDLVTLFPSLFDSFLGQSLIGKALKKKAFEVRVIDIRDFSTDKHRTADDRPFGGGAGMVLKPEPVARAVSHALESAPGKVKTRVILLSPAGETLNQVKVGEYAALDHLILVCGRYEGVDERVSRTLVDEEISVGDYILSGGEVPAMVLVEAVGRLLPGVVGKSESTEEETFTDGLLEYPHYTRPRVFQSLAVPEVLLSGDHAAIRDWRRGESLRRTLRRRPEMLARARLSPQDREVLERLREETEKGLDFSGPDD